MSLCPACDRPLTGTQQTCSPDCARAEIERANDESLRAAVAASVLPDFVACTYCGEDATADVCGDCDRLRDLVAIALVEYGRDDSDTTTPLAADRIMRLFFRGTVRP